MVRISYITDANGLGSLSMNLTPIRTVPRPTWQSHAPRTGRRAGRVVASVEAGFTSKDPLAAAGEADVELDAGRAD